MGRPTTASGLYRLRLRLAWSVFPRRFRLLLGLPFALAKVILLACLALRLTVRFSPDLRARRQPPRTRGVELPQRASAHFLIQINVKVKKMANFFATVFANSEKRCYVINEAGKQEFPETKK